MEQTRVDDMLIEMITPKVTEIQEKFGNGGALSQDDINTLLLKSQYNHINHLDSKLNEVVSDVASLKGDFAILRGEFDQFKTEISGKFDSLKESVEKSIAKALNKNMTMLVVVMGFFLTLSKLIDRF